jgi:SNF2 family DNA or RNA helicase
MSYLEDPKLQQTIAKLKEIRVRTELKAPPSKILRTTMSNGRPLTLRNYQVQGIMHLLAMPRFVLGDDTGLGKTLQAISALCYLWDKYPETPAVIMTTKSALNQWASEFDKFTTGVKCFVVSGDKKKRQKVYDDYFAHTGLKVLIMGYRTACMDFETLQNLKGHVQIFDEATAFKNDSTQVHQVCAHLSGAAQKVWSLSATIIKNRLMEAWAIYRVTVPGLMPSKNVFMSNYCICVDKQIGRKRIKFVVGHRKSDIEAFRIKIDPYFIGRPKHEVAQELPPLTTKRIEAPLSDVQISKYKEALSGILEKYDPTTGEMTEKEVTKLTAVMYCQQIVNHPELVDIKGDSGKLEILMELLEEELDGEKVIIFSRFRKMIDILDRELTAKGIKCVRITGGEKDDERKKSQESFQDEKSDVRVVLITMAAAEGVNLQLAKATIFYDSPWSAGDYLQIIGRMIRIGSIHDRVYCYHLVCPKTVDDRVMKALHNKMDLIENVLGKRLKNDEESDKIIGVSDNELKDIFNDLVEDAKENGR